MPTQRTDTQARLENITTCLNFTANTLETLASSLKFSFLEGLSNTTQSLLKNIETVKNNKRNCVELMEQIYELLNAIIVVHIKSTTGGELPPSILNHIGKFTETLHKTHTFVEAQQSDHQIKKFFRQGELSALLKECKIGLKQGLEFFKMENGTIMMDITKTRQDAEQRHQEVLSMIEALSETTSSDRASMISQVYSRSHNSSKSISMLPSKPKIFHGRESELYDILKLFKNGTPRIAILGSGGIGKTNLARAVVHHQEIFTTYEQHRFFVACDSAGSRVELAALIAAHLGLKTGKNLTQLVVKHFASSPPSLLILDNLETSWEPMESRSDIEEFLSLLTDVEHLSLIITMRGTERPAKVQWTRPFLLPLQPLGHDAAWQTFIEIADDSHNPEEVEKVLLLTDNMPLAISLLANLADSEGCANLLSRWEEEKTSLISDGFDKQSNLNLSISLSLSSPRLKPHPQSLDLLSLLSMLPDGLSDVELSQINLPIHNVLGCKAALIGTALAYSDGKKCLKALVPIREYMQKIQKPGDHLVRPLLKHFKALLEVYRGYKSNSTTVPRIVSNFGNIQNVICNGLQQDHLDLKDSINCALHLNFFSEDIGRGAIPFLGQLQNALPHSCDHRIEVSFIIEQLRSWRQHPISHPETLVAQALKHFEHFNDPDLQCIFYTGLASYYYHCSQDYSTAFNWSHSAISLSSATGNITSQAQAMFCLSAIQRHLGNYSAAQTHACEARRLARVSADLHREAQALHIEAVSWHELGNYKHSISLCCMARNLLALCGMSGSRLDHGFMHIQADVHRSKSEYTQAHSIQVHVLHAFPVEQNPYVHALTLLNVAETEVAIGTAEEDVQKKIDKAREIFMRMGSVTEVTMCQSTLAGLHLREGNILAARSLFEQSLKLCSRQGETQSFCLERLANVRCWGAPMSMTSWPIVFLARSIKFEVNLGIHKALQFLGDCFIAHTDEDTAISLYTVALERFTQLEVHRSRAECMLHLGDIYHGRGDLLKAVEFWETARPLFERSSQTRQVEQIDNRLDRVGEDVRERHRAKLANLAELTAPTSIVEEVEDDLSDVEDTQAPFEAEKALEAVLV